MRNGLTTQELTGFHRWRNRNSFNARGLHLRGISLYLININVFNVFTLNTHTYEMHDYAVCGESLLIMGYTPLNETSYIGRSTKPAKAVLTPCRAEARCAIILQYVESAMSFSLWGVCRLSLLIHFILPKQLR